MIKYILSLIISFCLWNFSFSQQNSSEPNTETTFEQDASFPGGIEKMKEFLKNNLKYPEVSRLMNEEGKVFVEFIVEKDGSISTVEVIQSISQDLDEEAVRLIKSMPNWNPAIVNGKTVRVLCTIPVNFELLAPKEYRKQKRNRRKNKR